MVESFKSCIDELMKTNINCKIHNKNAQQSA